MGGIDDQPDRFDTGLIYAEEGSPEAKGKVGKAFDYLQRRIPYLCERHKAGDVAEAQKIVDEVVHVYIEQRVHLGIEEVPQRR